MLEPGPYVVLEVSDTGYGMDKATLAKIFDPYFTTKKIGEGTGLGLSVVHGIVKSYGGNISVYSESGKGATFKVYLPRVVLEGTLNKPTTTEPVPRGNEKILFVDDDQAIVNLNRQLLESLGYQVTAMSNSLKALELFQEAPLAIDLVITDMTMPELNGLELSRRLRAIRPDVPIILCSGFSDLIDGEKARALGIDEFLMKPILTMSLANTVRRLLDKKRIQRPA